ncbi:peroxidase family protein [Lusitaniella coriacea]|uniref:peroxidase family protein n=1 Tax=Lusitaniella coriacea TaxID=1983105 RepID=UPI003CF22391
MVSFNPCKLSLGLATFATFSLATLGTAEAADFRSIDGSGNNIANPTWGATDTHLLRLLPSDYGDGISTPSGTTRPSARAVSNAVSAQSGSIPNSLHVSDWLWQWGQFIDHDIDLTEPHHSTEPFNIKVPTGDPFFDPFNTGTQTIGLERSSYDPTTGTGLGNPRQQINQISAYFDGSMVYGSDATRANFLRRNDGTGKLKTSASNLLPFNTAGLPNAGGTSSTLFIAGDVRANEQNGLTTVHTLFVREHNRLAGEIAADPDLSIKAMVAGLTEGEYIYQTARKIVGAQIQAITYNEFLPLLLGDGALSPYAGYNETVNAGISNEFSTGAFRVGHTMLSPQLLRINNDGSSPGNIALRDAFFDPGEIIDEGIDSLLLGLASQKAQEVDPFVVDDVRNFLFGPPGSGGFDLASLNIQRGRDHGVPSYNDARIGLGLGAVASFAEITSNVAIQDALASVYSSVDEIDFWVGGLAEEHINGGLVGELFNRIIADQFLRLRDGDRFFYRNDPHLMALVPEIGSTQLSDIIRRNSSISNIQDNVFVVAKDVPEPSAMTAIFMLGALGIVGERFGKKQSG